MNQIWAQGVFVKKWRESWPNLTLVEFWRSINTFSPTYFGFIKIVRAISENCWQQICCMAWRISVSFREFRVWFWSISGSAGQPITDELIQMVQSEDSVSGMIHSPIDWVKRHVKRAEFWAKCKGLERHRTFYLRPAAGEIPVWTPHNQFHSFFFTHDLRVNGVRIHAWFSESISIHA